MSNQDIGALEALAIILNVHDTVGRLLVADGLSSPIDFSPSERKVLGRVFNEIEDDLEVLAEGWGLAPISGVPMIHADDEFDDWGLLDDWDDELQEQEDFAQDDDFHNLDHSEME